MVRLDSTKILVPNEVINHVNRYDFILKQDANGDGVLISDKLQTTQTGLNGFKSIIIDNRTQTTTVELSAKILGSNYFEGINLNTVSQAVETINKTGIITFDVNRFLDKSQVLRCDVTDNIKPEVTGETFYKTLASLPIAQKYRTDLFNRKNNLGVTWNGQQKTIRDRIIFYDKTLDIIRDKQFKNSPYAHKLYNDFKGVVRVESNHSQFKQLNKIFGTRSLTGILESDVKTNYQIFNRITDKTSDIDLRLFNQFEGMKFGAIRNRLGDEGIIKLCNFDWQKIELFIKVYNTNNYRHYKKTIRAVYNDLNQQVNKTNLNLINHVKTLLYAA